MRRNVCHSVTEIPYPSLDDIKSVQNLVISADWMTEWSHSFIKDLQWNNRSQLSQSVSQLVNQSVNQSVSQSVSQSASRSVSQSDSQSVIQPVGQSASQSVNKPVSQSVSQQVSHSVCQSVSQSVSQSASQSVISQLASQSFSQSVSLSVRQSVSQPVRQSVSQSMILVKNCKFPFRLFQEKIGLEVVFNNYLVRKQVVLDYKILILNSGHIGFSQRGQPMILVKKWKFYHTLHQMR